VSVDADGSDHSSLTSGYFDADPAPSPTGATIVFASDRIGGFLPDLWMMQADGASPQVILDLPFASTTPDWQPVPVPGRNA
jgi:Tol biopolymer transport system component